ncbi:MAG TPA: FadR/GntR family transcriptional regulator [Ktedonobacteraceae bacterium]
MLTSPSPSPVRRQPLVKQVLDYLQQQITTGTFPVGSKLPPEPELMATLSVGRSTLREAMRVLAHMGLVDVRPGDGTYIRMPAPEAESLAQRLQRARVIEVYEVRRTLELECVRLAALRRDEDDLAALQRALHNRRTFLPLGNEEAFIDADLAFHTSIASATKNAVLADLYRAFISVNHESWVKASEALGSTEQGQSLHEQLADAIARRDPDHAQQLITLMLAQSTHHFQKILRDEGQNAD